MMGFRRERDDSETPRASKAPGSSKSRISTMKPMACLPPNGTKQAQPTCTSMPSSTTSSETK